jgi:argininosuccinate synthase
MKKLVLAYSGGLDTSYCVKHLSQLGYEVRAVSVNTGGFDAEEVKSLSAKATSVYTHCAHFISQLAEVLYAIGGV